MSDEPYFWHIQPEQDPWARIPELAKRLGVEPLNGTYSGRWVVRTAASDVYDIYELIFAFLDRVDRVAGDKPG